MNYIKQLKAERAILAKQLQTITEGIASLVVWLEVEHGGGKMVQADKIAEHLERILEGASKAAAVGTTSSFGRLTPVAFSMALSISSHPGLNSSPPTSAISPAIKSAPYSYDGSTKVSASLGLATRMFSMVSSANPRARIRGTICARM